MVHSTKSPKFLSLRAFISVFGISAIMHHQLAAMLRAHMRFVCTIVRFIANVKALGRRHFACKWSPGIIKVLCFFGN